MPTNEGAQRDTPWPHKWPERLHAGYWILWVLLKLKLLRVEDDE